MRALCPFERLANVKLCKREESCLLLPDREKRTRNFNFD